jgi:hypothetical protein
VSTTAPSADTDRLGKALGLYAQGWERVAGARLDQDAHIADNFLHPWQTTLNTSIAVALKARQAVRFSRLELDAAKQSYVVFLWSLHWCCADQGRFDRLKNASAVKQEQVRLEVENAEDDLVQKTEVAITLMKTVLENVCRFFSVSFAVADPLLLA